MGSFPRRNLSLPISTDGFSPRGGSDILSLPISTAGGSLQGLVNLISTDGFLEKKRRSRTSPLSSPFSIRRKVLSVRFIFFFKNIARDCTKKRSLQRIVTFSTNSTIGKIRYGHWTVSSEKGHYSWDDLPKKRNSKKKIFWKNLKTSIIWMFSIFFHMDSIWSIRGPMAADCVFITVRWSRNWSGLR